MWDWQGATGERDDVYQGLKCEGLFGTVCSVEKGVHIGHWGGGTPDSKVDGPMPEHADPQPVSRVVQWGKKKKKKKNGVPQKGKGQRGNGAKRGERGGGGCETTCYLG